MIFIRRKAEFGYSIVIVSELYEHRGNSTKSDKVVGRTSVLNENALLRRLELSCYVQSLACKQINQHF
jgi:hypothetical protein